MTDTKGTVIKVGGGVKVKVMAPAAAAEDWGGRSLMLEADQNLYWFTVDGEFHTLDKAIAKGLEFAVDNYDSGAIKGTGQDLDISSSPVAASFLECLEDEDTVFDWTEGQYQEFMDWLKTNSAILGMMELAHHEAAGQDEEIEKMDEWLKKVDLEGSDFGDIGSMGDGDKPPPSDGSLPEGWPLTFHNSTGTMSCDDLGRRFEFEASGVQHTAADLVNPEYKTTPGMSFNPIPLAELEGYDPNTSTMEYHQAVQGVTRGVAVTAPGHSVAAVMPNVGIDAAITVIAHDLRSLMRYVEANSGGGGGGYHSGYNESSELGALRAEVGTLSSTIVSLAADMAIIKGELTNLSASISTLKLVDQGTQKVTTPDPWSMNNAVPSGGPSTDIEILQTEMMTLKQKALEIQKEKNSPGNTNPVELKKQYIDVMKKLQSVAATLKDKKSAAKPKDPTPDTPPPSGTIDWNAPML